MRRSVFMVLFSVLLFVIAPSIPCAEQDEWYIGKPIKEFTFSGLVTQSVDDLQPIVKPYVGQLFTIDLYLEVQSKLFALDFFETIEGAAKEANAEKSEVVVNFTVKERPAVSAIVLKGNKEIGQGEILDKIVIKKGDLVSQSKVRADEAAIRSFYLEKGYTDITVSGSMNVKEEDNTAEVVFQMSEGSQTTVKEVRFSGNAFASESTLRNVMKTKSPFLFDSGVFQESKLEEDKTALVEYYTDHGYPDIKIEKIDRELQSEGGKNFVILTVYLSEGEQWTYGGLVIEGNNVFSTERLMELVYQKAGKILSIPKLKSDVQRIVDLYHEYGYIFNGFDIKEERDEKTRTITYRFIIVEHDKAHIESIIFKGNKLTKEYVLRRELSFEEGDVFNRTKIQNDMIYLYQLGFFSDVQPEPVVGSELGLMNIIFNVEEKSTADIQFGALFGGEGFPVSGTLKWADTNLGGMGRTLSIETILSTDKQSLVFSFIEPWMFDVRWSAGISLQIMHQMVKDVLQDIIPPVFGDSESGYSAPDPFETYEEYEDFLASGGTIPSQYKMSYESYSFGLGLSSGYRWKVPGATLGVQGSITSNFLYLTYNPEMYRPWKATVRNNLNTWNIKDQIAATLYLDGRDGAYSPTKGYLLSQGLSYTGGFLFGSRHYNRSDTTLDGFLTLLDTPVSDSWNLMFVLAAHTSFSVLLPQFAYVSTDGISAPQWVMTEPLTDPTDLVYIDGMRVARGWGQATGQVLWDNKLEIRMPIAKEVVWAVLFMDYVGLWGSRDNLTTMSLDNFLGTLGLGIRFTITQFPIRIYLGKRFRIENGQWTWQAGRLGDPAGFSFDFIVSLGGDIF